MNDPPAYFGDAYEAWRASLTRDELLAADTPPGSRLTLIAIALCKNALLTKGIKPAEQLFFLEKMNKFAQDSFHGDADRIVAMVAPMGDTELAIYKTAMSLDPPNDKTSMAGWNVLQSCRVFWHMLTLNPSILATLKWREAQLQSDG